MKISKSKIAIGSILLICFGVLIFLSVNHFNPHKILARAIARARIAVSSGQQGVALQQYQAALAIDAANPIALTELGQLRLDMDQPLRAAEQFEKCVSSNPDYGPAWLGIVKAYVAAKDVPRAESALTKLLEIRKDMDAQLVRGDVLECKESLHDALAVYKDVAVAYPQEFKPVEKLVKLLKQLGRDTEAKQALLQFAGNISGKERERALEALADAAQTDERYEETMAFAQRGLAIKNSAALRLKVALSALFLKQYQKAREETDVLFHESANPAPEAYYIRAACELQAGVLDEALRDAQVAQRGLPQDQRVAILLTRIHLKAKRIFLAEEDARHAVLMNPNNSSAQNILMQFLNGQTRYPEAVTLGRGLLEMPGQSDGALRYLIRAYVAQGKLEEARKTFETVGGNAESALGGGSPAANPNSEMPLVEKEAIEKLKQLPPAEFNSASSQFLLGQAYLRGKDLRQAMAAFERAVILDPSSLEPSLMLAGIQLALGHTDTASERLQSITQSHPDSLKAVRWLASIRLKQGKYSDVEQLFQRTAPDDLARLEPQVVELLHARMALGELDGISALAKKLKEGHLLAANALSLTLQAILDINSNRQREANELLEQALALDPACEAALNEKALIYLHNDNAAAAVGVFYAMENLADAPQPQLNEAVALLHAEKYKDAAASAFEEYLLQKSAETTRLLATCDLHKRDDHFEAGDDSIRTSNTPDHEGLNRDQAISDLQELLPTHPELAAFKRILEHPLAGELTGVLALADVYANAGHVAWMNECFETAHKIALQNENVAAIKADTLLRVGRVDEGTALLGRLVSENPSRTDFILQLADCRAQQGREQDAVSLYWRVLGIEPDQPHALAMLGTLLFRLKEYHAAGNLLEKAIQASPDDIVCLNNYVWNTAVCLNAPERALPFAKDLQRHAPGSADALDTAGWVYYLNKDYDAALGALESAAVLAPDSAAIAYHHGMALLMSNKKKDALTELMRAMAMNRHFDGETEAARALAEIAARK